MDAAKVPVKLVKVVKVLGRTGAFSKSTAGRPSTSWIVHSLLFER